MSFEFQIKGWFLLNLLDDVDKICSIIFLFMELLGKNIKMKVIYILSSNQL